MSDDTILTGEPANPNAGAADAGSGSPNAQPKGDAGKPAEPAAAKPDGGTQDPTKAQDGDKKPAQGQAAKPDPLKPAAAVVPEKYSDFTVPEDVELDKVAVEKFTTIAKELKLTQEQAQKLVDLQSQVASGSTQAALQQFDEIKEEWKQDTLKLLGKGAEKELAFAATARERFGTDQLRDYLETSGLGNHPAMVQFFISVGKAISEDTFTEGKHRAATAKTPAEILYPTMNK